MLKEVLIADKLSGGVFGEASLGIAKLVVYAMLICIPSMLIFAPLGTAPKIERYAQKNPNSFKGKVAKYYTATIPQKAVDVFAGLPPVKLKGYSIDWVQGAYFFVAGWLIVLGGSALLLGLGYLLATRCSSLLKTSPGILLWTPLLTGIAYVLLGWYLGSL